jgi:hypothetical protein
VTLALRGFKVQGSGFKVGFKVQGSRFKVRGSELEAGSWKRKLEAGSGKLEAGSEA